MGNDKNGERILNLLKKERITFLGKITNEETNGFSFILISRRLNRAIVAYRGINDEIRKNDVRKFQTDWFYISSMMKESLRTQIELAKKLKRKGTKIAFNPSEYLIRKIKLKPLLNLCDVLILNKEEAALLTGKENKLEGIYDMGPKIVVITDERRAVQCYDGKKIYTITPPKIKIVDKTGAGDAFASGFVAGLIKNKPIEFCLNLGVREAVSVIKYIGAKNNLIRMRLK